MIDFFFSFFVEMVRSFKDDMTSPLSRPIPSFKRPNTLPLGNSQKGNQILQPANKKLRRCESLKVDDSNSRSMMTSSMSMPTIDSPQISRPFLQMSLNSLSEANIKKACSLADEPNLTGDRSRKLSLPTISGKTLHSVVISWFFYHSVDFTWNQLLGIL